MGGSYHLGYWPFSFNIMSELSDPRSRNRVFLLIGITGLWFVVVSLRLVYLQAYHHKEFARQANEQQQDIVEVSPKRGLIYDRTLQELAVSIDVNSVYANPREIDSAPSVASQLATVLSLDEQDLVTKLSNPDRAFVWIKRKVTYREEEKLRSLQLPGIYFLKEDKRYYPNRDLAAHVLGFVGIDNKGLNGLEYSYDGQLQGVPGVVLIHKDAKRNSFFTEIKKPSVNGNALVLTIDKSLQYVAEQELAEVVAKSKAVGASFIAMDVHTGQILAMANVPKFNPNHYEDYSPKVWRNAAVSDAYEPGSTFKVIVASAALEENVARPQERIDCQWGSISVRGHTFHDHKRFGLLTVSQVLEKSSDVGAVKLGMRLGERRLFEYMRQFGIGAKTNIDLPGEHTGLLRDVSRWSKISIGAISFGQEVGVTPLQMLRATCAIANGGYLVKPYIVKHILSPSGGLIYSAKPERTRILSRETADTMAKILSRVIEKGTGKQAALDGYTAAGKTGTAQKVINGFYSQTKFVASFVGFAPFEKPAVAAIVVVDEPKGLYHGGDVAAPVFKKVVEKILIHLDVSKDKEMPPADAPSLVRNMDLPTPPVDKNVNNPSYINESGILIIDNSKEGSIVVPDFRGKSLRDVARECSTLGIHLQSDGTGVAVEQAPPPYATTFPGATCKVWFAKSQHVGRLASSNKYEATLR